MRRRIVILPGQYYDSETGLHYNWHRFYDPTTGRYISADPIGLEGGINLYAYVQNDPVNFIDPEGLYVIHPYFRDKLDSLSRNLGNKIITATAEAYKNCVHCAVECTAKVGAPAAATTAVIKHFVKQKAKKVAAAALASAVGVPHVALVTAGMETWGMWSCVYDCQSGR